jgi:Sporulation and spore germination
MTPRAKLLTLIVVAVVAGALIYLQVLSQRLKSQETPQADQAARARLAEASLQTEKGPQQSVTLFFPSIDEGVLLQETRRLTLAANDTDRIRQIFLALVEGSQQGHERPLANEAELRAAFLAPDGTAYLDLAGSSLPLFNPGIGSETLAIYSIVDSICINIPTTKRVRFLVQGQEVDTLNGHVDLTQSFVPDTTLNASGP